jgi:starch synthase
MVRKKINILMVAAELNPLAKVGGLADVIGALPKELNKIKSLSIDLCLPLYEHLVHLKKSANFVDSLYLPNKEKIDIYQTFLPKSKIKIYLFYNQKYLSRGSVYLHSRHHSSDINQVRFAFFNLAVIEFIKKIKPQTNLLHCHDWHAGLLPYLIKTDKALAKIKVLYTIHNIANQGIWNKSAAHKLKVPVEKIKLKQINFMEMAIIYADHVNTVSKTYAKEIMTNKYGYNLAPLLRRVKHKVSGILNGIDTLEFNPATDQIIEKKFNPKTIEYKVINKLELQKELELEINPSLPLLGVVSRLYEQKGLDWLVEIIPQLKNQRLQIVILGTGDKKLEKIFRGYNKKFSKFFKAALDFDPVLAQKIYAACDMFLVPSRFEPCGLTQLIAMRYGAVPIVRATGGLKDTVLPFKKTKDKIVGTGFLFTKESSRALYQTILQALKIYQDQPSWKQLQKNCLQQNFSWQQSALSYANLYKRLLK